MKKLILLLFLSTTSFALFSQVDTMTFVSAGHPGFSFPGWGHDAGADVLYPAAPNVNSIQTISRASCWNITSFTSTCFSFSCMNPSNGTWRVWSNLGDEYFFVVGGSLQTHTLNWDDIRWVKFQLQDPGTLGPNQTYNFDNVIHELLSYTSASAPALSLLVAPNGCVGSSATYWNLGALNDATEWAIYTGSCGGTLLSTTTSAIFSVTPSVTTTYYINGINTNGAGCVADGPCVSVTIVVDKFPSTVVSNVLTSADTLTDCALAPVTLVATGGVEGSGSVVHWYNQFGGAIGTGDTLVVSPISTQLYHCRREGDCNTTGYTSKTITVVSDVVPPAIVCPPSIIVQQFHLPGAPCMPTPIPTPTLTPATATDVCGVFNIAHDNFGLLTQLTTTVNWSAIDNYGNASTCPQDITVDCIECTDPIGLPTTVTVTTATLDWTSVNELAPWEVEVVQTGTSPNLSGDLTATKPYTVTGLTPFTDYDYYVRTSCGAGNGNWAGPFTFTTDIGYQFAPKVFLQGPYDEISGLMNDDLRATGLMPLAEPYTAMGLTLPGTVTDTLLPDVLAVTGPDAIVDWVLVEFRSFNDISNIYSTKCALLQRDGDVVEPDGVSPLTFNCILFLAPYVAIRHRNHLGIVSSSPISAPSALTVLDFTDGSLPTYGFEGQYTQNGVNVMWAGETTNDGVIKYVGSGNDRDPILVDIGGSVPTASTSGYLSTDVNMDGVVKYVGADNDRDPVLVNIGGSVPTNTRLEQLP